jgi:hypothetical protein
MTGLQYISEFSVELKKKKTQKINKQKQIMYAHLIWQEYKLKSPKPSGQF